MIEGLKLDVPGADIKAHIATRAAYHRQKQVQYKQQHDGVETLMEDMPDKSSADPRAQLLAHGKSHGERADYFDFLARYILDGEIYRLSQDDLRTLEFVSRGW